MPRLTRRQAAVESALAGWLAARRLGGKLAGLAGGAVRVRLDGLVAGMPDPHAAHAELRIGGISVGVAGASAAVRAFAQRLLGGPAELAAARPVTAVEHAVWALVVAAAVADLGIDGEVWPLADAGTGAPGARVEASDARASDASAGPPGPGGAAAAITVAFTVELPGHLSAAPMTVTASFPADALVRPPPARRWLAWSLDLPVVVGRCALDAAGLAGLAVRDVITIAPRLELVVGAGGIGLSADPGAVEARVATEYGPHDVALADDAMLEITVQLGTTRLSLRQLGELAIGQIVPLGRPLAGPYEVRAAGRMLGHGELVDIDGELGVRIVSIAEPVTSPAATPHQANQE